MNKKPSETKSKEIGMRYFLISFVAKPKTNFAQLTYFKIKIDNTSELEAYGDFTLSTMSFPTAHGIRQSIINLGYVRPAILNIIELSKTDYESFTKNAPSN